MLKSIITIATLGLFVLSNSILAQKSLVPDTLFLDIEMNEIQSSSNYAYILIHHEGINKKPNGLIELRDKDGELIESVLYSKGRRDGAYFKFDILSETTYEGFYKKDKKNGTWYLKTQSGTLLLEENYKNGRLIGSNNYEDLAQNIQVYTRDEVATPTEFPGGLSAWNTYLANNLKYPEEARRGGYEGIVFTEMVVMSNGVIGQLKDITQEDVDESLIKEAQRVIKFSGLWNPATLNGEPVASLLRIRIVFKLR